MPKPRPVIDVKSGWIHGDITPRNEPAVVKLYGCLVMVLGSAFIATLYSIITDLLITIMPATQ